MVWQYRKKRCTQRLFRGRKMGTAEERQNWFDAMASVMEQNTLGVKITIYGLGVVGCGYAIRSVRPFAKFRSPGDIPRSFFESKIKLSGQVVGLRFGADSTLLLVDHRPALLGKFREPGALPVAIESISLTSNGVCWLQTIVKDDEIDFELVEPKDEAVSCIIYHKKDDVGKRLLSLGLASVAPFNRSFENDKRYAEYYKELLKLEAIAEKKKVGMWWDGKRYSSLTDFVIKNIKRLLPLPTKSLSLLR